MKKKISIFLGLSLFLLIIVFYSKPVFAQIPTIRTNYATDVQPTSVKLNGVVININGEYIHKRGFSWGTFPGDCTNSWFESGEFYGELGEGSFSHTIDGLDPETEYYFRAEAWNFPSNGWGTGLSRSVKTTSSFCQDHNVWGWAWSKNIGWISFSCQNCDSDLDGNLDGGSCGSGGSVDYGVDIDENGLFSGSAWSSNIGWISFNSADFVDCPSAPCKAQLDLDGTTCGAIGQVCGWANWIGNEVITLALYQHYEEDTSDSMSFYDGCASTGQEEAWQSFTVKDEDHKVDYVSLKLKRRGSPGDLTVGIWDINPITGIPTGLRGCDGIIDSSSLPLTEEWVNINLEGNGCDLFVGGQYAIGVKAPMGAIDEDNDVYWYYYTDWLGGGYPGGSQICRYFTTTTDMLFQVWGTPLGKWQGNGWIKLAGTVQGGGSYGVSLNSAPSPSEFEGWAWGGHETDLDEAVIGWVSFNRLNTGAVQNYKVMTSISLNARPSATNLNVTEYDYCFKDKPPIRLEWKFEDDDPGDTQSAYRVQIDGIDKKLSSSLNSYPPTLSFGTSYSWKVKVWDNKGAESEWSAWNSFATDPPWPEPDFTWCPEEPFIGEPVQFCSVFGTGICDQAAEPPCSEMAGSADDLTKCKGALCVKWEWDFDIDIDADGDGISDNDIESTDKNPTYSYSSIGDHRAQLTVTDANGHACPRVRFVPAKMPLPIWKEIPPF